MDNCVKIRGTFECLQVVTDKVAKMTLKVNGWKDGEFDLIPVTVFSKQMDDVKRLKKGQPVTAEGRLKSRSFMSKTGNEITNIEMVLGKMEAGSGQTPPRDAKVHDRYEDVPF